MVRSLGTGRLHCGENFAATLPCTSSTTITSTMPLPTDHEVKRTGHQRFLLFHRLYFPDGDNCFIFLLLSFLFFAKGSFKFLNLTKLSAQLPFLFLVQLVVTPGGIHNSIEQGTEKPHYKEEYKA